jgi:hypothetical protein
MRTRAGLVFSAIVLGVVGIAAESAGYRVPQPLGTGGIVYFFVEVDREALVELSLRDSDGGLVAPPQKRAVGPKEPWVDQARVSRPVGVASRLSVTVTATPPQAGYRFGASVKGFQVGSVNGVSRVQATSAPIIREPVQCTNLECQVCYTLEQNDKLVFDSNSTATRTVVKHDFDPNAPAIKGTWVAKWKWPDDVRGGEHFVSVMSTNDGTGTTSGSFRLPPGPPPTKCP